MPIARVLWALIAVMALGAAGMLYWHRQGDPNRCEARCMSDEPCMRGLDAEDIAPFGMTRGDQGLCNGICSALRASRRDARRAEEMGFSMRHPCLPEP